MTAAALKVSMNKMSLSSINAFFSINGRFSGDEKDCYFLRYIGYTDQNVYIETLLSCEKHFAAAAKQRRSGYLRTDRLPFPALPEKIAAFSEIWGRLESAPQEQQTLGVSFSFHDAFLDANLVAAVLETVKLFRETSPHCTDSIVKNFVMKLLAWIEAYGPKLFPAGFTPATSPKFVYNGTVKLQEYLFLYLLTRLGCDVLLLCPQEDVTLPAECLALSQAYREPNTGAVAIPKYEDAEDGAAAIPEYEDAEDGAVAAAGRNTGAAAAAAAAQTAPPAGSGRAPQRTPIDISRPQPAAPSRMQPAPQAPAAELDYEQLAAKASSVVMIEVLNDKGECFKTGSGVMISRDGYILTNSHVVAGGVAFAIRIETEEQVYQTSRVIKYNNLFDLAILQIERVCDPIPLSRNDKLTRGQKVVAIGSPLGLFNSVSDGIISAFRTVNDTPMIQFTAPISSGSSGGAVLNMHGELIGLSTAGFDAGQNLNLAVDYETIRMFIGNLCEV